jgi:hypothetical protein
VVLRLARGDGHNPPACRRDLGRLPSGEVADYVAGLSTRARLDQFAVDYRFPLVYEPLDDGTVRLSLRAAMDYLTPAPQHLSVQSSNQSSERRSLRPGCCCCPAPCREPPS